MVLEIMNKNKKAVLIGLCLGDGNLSKPDQWDSVSLRVEHCAKQKELIEYKAALLRTLTGKQVKISERERERKGNTHKSYRFSCGIKYFRLVRKMLYKNGIKVMTDKVLNKLNDQAVAIWVMDDGTLSLRKKDGVVKGCQFKLCTCTTIEENETIRKFFKKRYGVNFSIVKHMVSRKSNQPLYSLLCGTREYLKLAKVIDKYIIPSMKYKTEILRTHECQTS
jgi:hypothetical protein